MLFTEGEPFSPSLFRLARRGDAREAWGLPRQQRGAGGDEESSIQKPPPSLPATNVQILSTRPYSGSSHIVGGSHVMLWPEVKTSQNT